MPIPPPVIVPITLEAVSFASIDYHMSETRMNWADATAYAASLGAGWRLPTKDELQAFGPQLKNQGHTGDFWSSSTVANSSIYAWVVYLTYGANFYFNTKESVYGVICVR
jgi:hypothetical protein